MTDGGFACNTPAGQVSLSDLPLGVLHDIATEAGVRWTSIVLAPASTALSALVTYRVCCERLGCEPEELTARSIMDGDVFEVIEDDLPTVFEDGAPDPKAEGEIPTGGSSGEPSDSDGPPT